MDEFMRALSKKFGDKYSYLKLYEVVYDKRSQVCTFTFLYPHTISDMESESRKELENFAKDYLALNGDVRVKFKKSFLDEKLIRHEVKNFFEEKHKSLLPYFKEENLSSTYEELEVKINLKLNKDLFQMIDKENIIKEMVIFLSKRFIANFEINLVQNEEVLPDEVVIDEDMLPSVKKTMRYEVNIEGSLIGSGIASKPEYIKDIQKPKLAVILAGVISGFTQKTFVRKKGKRAGEEGIYYTFNLNDGNSIDCIYFCGKTNLKKMESLADGQMIVCIGDVNTGISGKLTYYIKKIALASPKIVPNDLEEQEVYKQKKRKWVACVEPVVTNSQSNLFEGKVVYNDNIMSHTFVVFDIETTGLDPETCEITEIGAVKIEHGVIKERFSSFVKPTVPIPMKVQLLTHITDEMVKDAPSIENVIADFYEWTRGCVLSGYNVIDFDMKFIKKAGQKYNYRFDNDIIDTLIVARTSKLRCSNYKLGTVVSALGLTLEGAHRAYNDAHATAQVLLALSKI